MADAKAGALLAALSLTWLALSACSRQGQDEMSWARAALERNDHLEIVAADREKRTFTVRNKDTDEVSIVRADQLIAGATAPGPPGVARASAPAAPPATAAATAPAAPVPAAPAAEAAAQPAAVNAAGTSIASPGEAAEPPAPAPQPAIVTLKAPQPLSRARRVPGQVLVAGPGYSIEAGSSSDAGFGAEARSGIEAGFGTALTKPRAPAASGGAIQLRHEPIVCQGARLMHLDNLDLQFDGDAVSAQDGCEIHITNSHIRAAGVGVSARAANVHIDNSLIEGDAAAIEASDGAQVYTASSKFRGMSRRLDTATVHDLGGNVWN
jgi:hypothetical protein